jgi:hypothetical protein
MIDDFVEGAAVFADGGAFGDEVGAAGEADGGLAAPPEVEGAAVVGHLGDGRR